MENLTVTLEQTGHSWTLEAEDKCKYQMGTRGDCDIILPCVNFADDVCLELSYDSDWYVKDNGSSSSIFINHQRLNNQKISIADETHINLAGGMILIARLASSPSNGNKPNALVNPTRLLSGYVYFAGFISALELLNQLRTDPYKATIPKDSSLDLEKVMTHAAQSVVISLTFSCLALVSCLLGYLFIFITQNEFNFYTVLMFGFFPAFLIAFESIYLRWFNARRFLKKYYTSNSLLNLLPPILQNIVNYLKKSLIQTADSQNIITFAGSNPFVGSGELIPASKWTVPITRKKKKSTDDENWGEPEEYLDIPVDEFYQAVEQGIEQLKLPNLTKFTRLYRDGFELEVDGKFLRNSTSRPAVMYVDDPLLIKEQSQLGSKQRAYRVYQYVDHQRDYIISYFLRFYNAGSVTFAESSAYILSGIDRQRFSLSTTLKDTQISRILKMIIGTIIFSSGLYLVLVFYYIGIFIYYLISWKLNDFWQRRAAILGEEYNYGIEQTFREFIAEPVDFNQQDRLKQTIYLSKNPIYQLIINFFRVFRVNIIGIIIIILLLPLIFSLLLPYLVLRFLLSNYRNTTDPKVTFDYYGTQDLLMYWKAIQTSVFNSTIRFLKSKDIDTSDFELFTANIVSNTTNVTAGNITNSQVAIGAKSNFSQGMNNPQA